MNDRNEGERADRIPPPDRTSVGGSASLIVETARALRDGWPGAVLAMITALVGLLLADLLGDSDDAVVLVAVLGAALGTWLHGLAQRFPLKERTLSAIAGVLALLAWPRSRAWMIERAGAAATSSASTMSTAATLANAVVITVLGTFSALALSSSVLPEDEPRRFGSPEEAIAAQLERSTFEYVGSCAAQGAALQRGRRGPDRRVCSSRVRRQEGGALYAIGNLDHGLPIAILRENERGWTVVRCLNYCG